MCVGNEVKTVNNIFILEYYWNSSKICKEQKLKLSGKLINYFISSGSSNIENMNRRILVVEVVIIR